MDDRAVANAGGYPGSPFFRIMMAGTERSLTATAGGELTTMAFSGAPEQLWRIDQLVDGSYRIVPKSIPGTTDALVLSAVGSSMPTLAKFDPASDRQRWLLGAPCESRRLKCNGVCSMCLAGRGAVPAELPQRAPRHLLTHPKGPTQPVDVRGFIHRWLVLEPVPVPGRLTESAVKEALQLAALPECGAPSRRRDCHG